MFPPGRAEIGPGCLELILELDPKRVPHRVMIKQPRGHLRALSRLTYYLPCGGPWGPDLEKRRCCCSPVGCRCQIIRHEPGGSQGARHMKLDLVSFQYWLGAGSLGFYMTTESGLGPGGWVELRWGALVHVHCSFLRREVLYKRIMEVGIFVGSYRTVGRTRPVRCMASREFASAFEVSVVFFRSIVQN